MDGQEKKEPIKKAVKNKGDVLPLKKPIEIDGKKVAELAYNFDDLTGADLNEIDRNVARALGGTVSTKIQGMDNVQNRYTFMQAVIKVDDSIDVRDLERMHAWDIYAGEKLARNFILGLEDGEEATSEEP